MKQYRLVHSRLSGFLIFLLLSFCIFFVTTTHSEVNHHRRLWSWPPPESGPGPPPKNKTAPPAVFFFGDSIIDTGNNNNLSTSMKCNFRPYGMDFPSGVATGRFSNGKVVSDYIAEYLGLKSIIPAYLDPNIQTEDLLTGVSFASGGSGFYHLTPQISRVTSMSDQLTYFEQYKARVKKLVGEEKLNQILTKGLVMVVAGSNDIALTYYGQGARRLVDDIDYFTSKMANSAASFVMQLYGYGARQIAVVGTTPIGCIPLQRTLKGGRRRNCAQDLNYASQLFNAKLSLALDHLSTTLPNSLVLYLDSYSPFSHILEYQLQYGFEEVKKGCCGTGLVEIGALCNRYTSSVCSNTSAYMFWDSVHPTQRFYEVFTKLIFDKYIVNLS